MEIFQKRINQTPATSIEKNPKQVENNHSSSVNKNYLKWKRSRAILIPIFIADIVVIRNHPQTPCPVFGSSWKSEITFCVRTQSISNLSQTIKLQGFPVHIKRVEENFQGHTDDDPGTSTKKDHSSTRECENRQNERKMTMQTDQNSGLCPVGINISYTVSTYDVF